MLRIISCVSVVVSFPAIASAGLIAGYDPQAPASHEIYDRFIGTYPSAPAPNTSPNFVLNGFTNPGVGRNLSGLGWSTAAPEFGMTLVSPQHILTNWHVGWAFPPGASVSFLNRNGVLKTYALKNAAPFRPTTTFDLGEGPISRPADILLATLTQPIPETDLVDFLPVLSAPDDWVVGARIYVDGQNSSYVNPQTGVASRHIGLNSIDGIDLASFDGGVSEATVVSSYNFGGTEGEIFLVGGDSGAGSFVNVSGQLALVGTHYGIDVQNQVSYDAYIPHYIDQLDAAMLSGTPYRLTITAVPEPSTWVLTGLVAALGAMRRRRFRCPSTSEPRPLGSGVRIPAETTVPAP